MTTDTACPLDVKKQFAAARGVTRMFASVTGVRLAIERRRGNGRVAPSAGGASGSRPECSSQGRRRIVDGLLAAVHDAPHLEEAVKLAVIPSGFHVHSGGAEASCVGFP